MAASKTPAPKKAEAKPAAAPKKQEHAHTMLAIVRVRGPVRAGPAGGRALNELGLYGRNWCALRPDTDATRNLLFMAKDYATWGPLDASTRQALVKARGERNVYTLSPPRGGYGHKGIKLPFRQRGALGNRGESINKLITRMM
jgi:ribosomal protein L30/L7E